ncbi:MAG: tripartite tricarboxylate transporter permease [Limisphaerales bacterium]
MITELLHPTVLLPWLLAMAFGLFVGATPGLTATMAVALIVPISFYMPDPTTGLAMIIGVSFTAIFAGDIPAVFLRIPGTPASAATTLDGHALALQGKAGPTLLVDLLCSCLGGLIGVLLLIFLAPWLASFALRFSNYEYFWLAVLGLSLSAAVSAGSTLKGILAAVLGILISTVGIDTVSGTPRLTFKHTDLMSGIGFIPVMIGLFGLSEVIRNLRRPESLSAPSIKDTERTSILKALSTMAQHWSTILKGSVVGTVVGALPGAGADIAAWGAYGLEQKTSRHPERFGQGTMEGVIAPASAHNGAVGGAWIPALVFGIPGDSVTAIVIGAMLMYNLKPGPLIFEQSAHEVHSIFAIALVTQFLLIPCGLLGIKLFSWILRLPRSLVMVGVVIFSIVGAFALTNSLFDVYIMAAFGLIGFYLESQRMPMGPLILGLILGPMVEENFRTGLIKSHGSFEPFLTRPISATLWILLVASFALPILMKLLKRRQASTSLPSPSHPKRNGD